MRKQDLSLVKIISPFFDCLVLFQVIYFNFSDIFIKRELIGASKLAENIELSTKSNKSTTQMDIVESDGLKKVDQNGPQTSTQSECNSGNSIEEDCNDMFQ